MAKQSLKRVKSPPITSHPLFAAVVALWFGALFGLGSLAVRPSLIEGLVLRSHIDLIIPATAPPLGVTARILIALVLATLGAVLGIALARRIARPKVTEIERKRSAKDPAVNRVQFRARDAHPDAPARAPISAHEELGYGGEAPNPSALRRRALVNETAPYDFVPHDMAPVPGSAPQIYGLTEVDHGGSEAAAPEALDLGALALPTADLASSNPPPLDWTNVALVALPDAPITLDNVAVHAEGRQVFGMAPQPEQAEQPRQIFGMDATDGRVSQEFVKAAGYSTTVFDRPEASPLFASRSAPLAPAAEAEIAHATPLPSPADLDMTDLAKRLADAMRRRRDSKVASLPAADPVPVAIEAEVPQFSTAPASDQPMAALPPEQQLQSLPSAMRPLALDAFLEEAASLIPPRHIAMPSPVAEAPPAPLDLIAVQISDDEPGEAGAEENYGSLLGLAPARESFVRVDDPASELVAHEPVVIFPGQAPRLVEPVPTGMVEAEGSFRRFDSPSSAGQGQPLAAATNAAPAVDPAEAERALRAALSNLQRMSGTA